MEEIFKYHNRYFIISFSGQHFHEANKVPFIAKIWDLYGTEYEQIREDINLLKSGPVSLQQPLLFLGLVLAIGPVIFQQPC